jgi:methionyl-tRNA synthetase
MSKSTGKVVYPEPLIEKYGLDPLRYFLLKELPYSGDGVFTPEDFIARINFDLANDFGNLLNRTINMINKYFDSKVYKPEKSYFEFDAQLTDLVTETVESYKSDMDILNVSKAIQDVWTLISRTNKYIDETKPWVLAKDAEAKKELNSVLYNLVESLRHIGILLSPILINSSKQLFDQLNIPLDLQKWDSLKWGEIVNIEVTDKPTPIFPRLDKKIEEEYIVNLISAKEEEPALNNLIEIEDFLKIELVVGEILESNPHPDADKLLVSKIDTGDKVRQIVSGISKYYTTEELIGKKVIVVKNLKPVKLRGVMSEGMILAGKNKKDLEVLEVTKLKAGDIVS